MLCSFSFCCSSSLTASSNALPINPPIAAPAGPVDGAGMGSPSAPPTSPPVPLALRYSTYLQMHGS